MNEIKVKCKNCGMLVPTNELVLDNVFKMMVCRTCVKDRKMREDVHKELGDKKGIQVIEEKKPKGWDKDDDMLDKLYREKQKEVVQAEKISDDRVRYTCPKCGYKFQYDILAKKPSKCPYCDSEIAKMRY